MKNKSWFTSKHVHAFSLVIGLGLLLMPALCFADVEGSITNMKNHLTHVILPALSVIGLALASVSFFTGSPQAKQHIVYAILGCCFGFGAQIISDFISSLVR